MTKQINCSKEDKKRKEIKFIVKDGRKEEGETIWRGVKETRKKDGGDRFRVRK